MKVATTLACLLALGCGSSSSDSEPTAAVAQVPATEVPAEPVAVEADALDAAVASAQRPEEDRARDAQRKPAETMRIAGIYPGATVVDLMGGTGYYSELFARAVGPEGKVFVQNTKWVLEKFAEGPLTERLTRLAMDNVSRWDKELDALELPEGSVDVAFMGLFYHDAFWLEVDRAKMNAGILAGLKPGGIFLLTDHHAEAGSKDRDVKTLHRIDAEIVKAEVVAAGFEFVEASEILSHGDDARTINVFDPAIRGKTDRFVYKFRKPN